MYYIARTTVIFYITFYITLNKLKVVQKFYILYICFTIFFLLFICITIIAFFKMSFLSLNYCHIATKTLMVLQIFSMKKNTSYFCWFWTEILSEHVLGFVRWSYERHSWILASHDYWCLHQMMYWLSNAFSLPLKTSDQLNDCIWMEDF